MKISAGVSYHAFDDKVYVHNVKNQCDYVMSGIAGEILDYVAKNPTCSVPKLLKDFSAQYDEVDADEIQRDIGEFVDELLGEKILTEADDPEEPWSNKVPMEVAKNFAARHKLFSIGLELTYRCVEKCIHCYIDDASKFCAADELTTDEYKNILRQARELGCIQVLFTGGEVLLRPDLCDLVEYASELGLIVNVYTTGLGLTDEIFDRLCGANVNGISVSLYSGVAEEHDKITGVKGSFDKTLKAALMFKAAGVNTFIKGVVMKQNFASVESLYKLGKRLNLYVSISPKIVSGHARKCADDYSLGDVELYKKFYSLQKKYVPDDATAQKFSRDEILSSASCGAGRCSFSIDPCGGVHACITFRETFGSVKDDDLKTLWERAGHLDLKNGVLRGVTPKCETCDYSEYCTVCVADLRNRNHGDFRDCGETFSEAQAASEVFG